MAVFFAGAADAAEVEDEDALAGDRRTSSIWPPEKRRRLSAGSAPAVVVVDPGLVSRPTARRKRPPTRIHSLQAPDLEVAHCGPCLPLIPMM